MNSYLEFMKNRRSPVANPTGRRPIEMSVLQDWAQRVHVAADEAGDEHLLALETDLLDLWTEIYSYLK